MTPMTTTRTYELFDIEWTNEDGSKSRWTGFDTEDECKSRIQNSGRAGRIIRRVWTVDIPDDRLHLYKPGI